MIAETRQLDAMREAAFRLGMAFAEAAEAEGELDRKLALFDAFHRSFASVRLSIALAMRLRRELSAPLPVERPERDDWREDEPAEAPERLDAGPERYDERDRDRDREPVSLPRLLDTLEQVADDARALMPQAAELPTLTELLDRVRGAPKPLETSPAPPKPSGALRARLSGGTATLTLPPLSGLPGLGAASRATGPPPRRSP